MDNARAHQERGEFAEAATHARALCELDPLDAESWVTTSILYIGAKNYAEAVRCFRKGLMLEPENTRFGIYFTDCIVKTGVSDYSPEIQGWLSDCLKKPETINIATINILWHRMLKADTAFSKIMEGAEHRDYADFKNWIDNLDATTAEKFQSDILLDGLCNLIVPDLVFEQFLTNLRRRILEHLHHPAAAPPWVLSFTCALAEHCFMNEYIFHETAEEKERIDNFLDSSHAGIEPLALMILACYRPLHAIPSIIKAARVSRAAKKNPAIARVLKLQIDEPGREIKLKKKISSLAQVTDKISQEVRQQYEENPYPRWRTLGAMQLSVDQVFSDSDLKKHDDILIAGSGTGQHLIHVCKTHPNARVTGIDLSYASLAYTLRKAREMKMRNIKLIQGDLLELKNVKKKFDIIESVGVLHHMKNPEQGLQVLYDALKPGGLIKIGLYSELARGALTQGRAYIAKAGLPSTVEGIREFRRRFTGTTPEITENHPLGKLALTQDFYTTSMIRDCLFHVQEHLFSIPRIEGALNMLDMEFLGFVTLPAAVRQQYLQKFPDDPGLINLGYWHQFEELYPDTFIRMYQFWARKR